MAQNEELTTEAVEAEENLTSYTSESGAAEAAAPKKERPALTVAGAAVGRRKEAVARVRVVPGSGKWTINGRELANYFPNKLHQQDVNERLKTRVEAAESPDKIEKLLFNQRRSSAPAGRNGNT